MFQPYSLITINMMDCIVQSQNQKGGLYLGNIESAGNGNLLQFYKIGAILTTMSTQEYRYDGNISSMFIRVDDADFVNLSQYFQQAIDFIDYNRQFTNVLVHCYAGISRSATIVIAYLMKSFKMTLDQAFSYVQQQRPIINPNPGFMKQLQQYEIYLFNIFRYSQLKQNEMYNNRIYSINNNQHNFKYGNLFDLSKLNENQDNKQNSLYPIGTLQRIGNKWIQVLPQMDFNSQYENNGNFEFIQN